MNSSGYGQIHVNGTTITAHRWAWARANGPIPRGLYCCHACDVRRCVNPAHLFLGTAQDNTRDAIAKGRHRRPTRKTHCKRGHLIETRASGVRVCKECHRMHRRASEAQTTKRKRSPGLPTPRPHPGYKDLRFHVYRRKPSP